MNKKLSIIFSFLLIILLSLTASAEVEIGGEVGVDSNISFNNNQSNFYLTENLNLKLFIPQSEKTEVNVDFSIKNTQFGPNTNFNKLYIKRKYNNFNISIGRQPVSWSFGSLINPVDFNFGAEVMDQSQSAKYIDAVKFYLPVNWKTGLEIVANPNIKTENNSKTKSGIRYRTMINDYDLSLNYVYNPLSNYDNKLGLSLKGDLGPLGLYSAVSYEKAAGEILEDENVYLLGLDYSKSINYDQRIYLQGEIINLSSTKVEEFASTLLQSNTIDNIELADERYNLFAGNISYSINNFSSFNLFLLGSINNSSFALTPQYKNQLPGNIELTISSILATNKNEDIFNQENIPLSININLNYSF